MKLYAVRVFKDEQWHIVRWYESRHWAQVFAKGLETEWDVKAMTIEEANEAGA